MKRFFLIAVRSGAGSSMSPCVPIRCVKEVKTDEQRGLSIHETFCYRYWAVKLRKERYYSGKYFSGDHKEKWTRYIITSRRRCWRRYLACKAGYQMWLKEQAKLGLMRLVEYCRGAIRQGERNSLLSGIQMYWVLVVWGMDNCFGHRCLMSCGKLGGIQWMIGEF